MSRRNGVERYAFEDVLVRGSAVSFPTVYALGMGDEWGVYEYRIPQAPDPQ